MKEKMDFSIEACFCSKQGIWGSKYF